MINKILADYARKVINPRNISSHDAFCACIALSEGDASFIPEPTSLYRRHGKNLSGGLPKLANVSCRKAIRKAYHFIKYIALSSYYNFKHYKDFADEILLSDTLRNQKTIDFLKKVSYAAEFDKIWLINEIAAEGDA